MIVKKYGIELVRLEEEDLELVRVKRNAEEIRKKMFFQKIISPEEQIKWFNSINNTSNFYFIIKTKNEKIGLIHGKICSHKERIAEGGMFIWDEKYLGSHIPLLASVCMTDLTFLIMKMDKTIAEVREDNEIAINYNLQFGYKITQKDEESGKLLMELTRDDYFIEAKKIRDAVKKISNDNTDLSLNDIVFKSFNIKELYDDLPNHLKDDYDNGKRQL